MRIYRVTVNHPQSGHSWEVMGCCCCAEDALDAAKMAIAAKMGISVDTLSCNSVNSWYGCDFMCSADGSVINADGSINAVESEAMKKRRAARAATKAKC